MPTNRAAYSEKLRDPRWQKMRLRVMEAAGWRCKQCGDERTTLNVHHVRYFRGRSPWEYRSDDLECLCENCHRFEHDEEERARYAQRQLVVIAQMLAEKLTYLPPRIPVSREEYLEKAVGMGFPVTVADRSYESNSRWF